MSVTTAPTERMLAVFIGTRNTVKCALMSVRNAARPSRLVLY